MQPLFTLLGRFAGLDLLGAAELGDETGEQMYPAEMATNTTFLARFLRSFRNLRVGFSTFVVSPA